MTASEPPATVRVPRDPWFRRRPALAVGVAVVLYATVLVLRLSTGGPADAHTMLFALPVALLAGAFGLRAGLLAGVVAVALIEFWVAVSDVSLSATGWVSRAVPLLLLGVLVGQASDQARRAEVERLELEAERRELEAAALLHREAIEINDSLIQGMVAAKWSLESGQVEAGRRILEGTITQAQEMVSRLIRRAEMGGRAESIER
ncbi:MAG TPA: hypothetical protein VFT70_03870 [Nocardioides sp.]|nr:hypothetical protein [Nocardioides sp.]